MTDVCETCGGEGKVPVPCPDERPPNQSCTVLHLGECPACHGTGRKPVKDELKPCPRCGDMVYEGDMCQCCGRGDCPACNTLTEVLKPVKDAAERMSDDALNHEIESLDGGYGLDVRAIVDELLRARDAESAAAERIAALESQLTPGSKDERYPTVWAYEQACHVIDEKQERIAALEAELADKKHDYAEGWNEGHDESFRVTEEMREYAEYWRMWKALVSRCIVRSHDAGCSLACAIDPDTTHHYRGDTPEAAILAAAEGINAKVSADI